MMSYNYSEIREYIKKICQKFDVKIPLSADLTSWEMAKEAIERAAKAFQSAVMVSSPPQERQRLFAALMIEIGRATFFAQQNPNYVTRLDIYIAGALDYVQQFQGLAELTQPEYQRTDKQISIEQTKDKTEVDDFRGYSSAFKKLCDYQKFLSADTRHHLFRVQDKAEKLGIPEECLIFLLYPGL